MSGVRYFLYFAFGSNLLKERLQLQNPSAVFHRVARLQGYGLKFGLWAENVVSRWNGGVATIEECPDEEVWGVVWKMAIEDITSLDKQESVDKGVYSPMEVMVETETGPLLCRTYKMNNFRPCAPSPQYKEVICLGAQQNGLPEHYIKKLQAVEANNYTGPSILDNIKKLKN
ncbi:gamma-glutamylcyclotransferase a [Tachysurus fulvidraco]|uniref:gamma-glutamylcyclotransferase a n=1 Tax=Tachysurus fulvidraco TaxID=1234273 RepID=UPI001FEF489D|nr:gamma-glutamylcyclotransferase a [Tachysurus fulvidraco]